MSTLYIYPDCKITRDRNCKVDSIQDYLSSIRVIPAITIQYQQIDLKKTLKLNMDQSVVGTSPLNYLEIVQDNKSFYYFIDAANWKSTSTVEFELTLDTVNTFASDFSFNKKTHITRQHKDRIAYDKEIEVTPIDDWGEDDWEYVPTNKYIVLNPWAYENEVRDTFFVAGMSELQSCVITKRRGDTGEILETYSGVRRLEQAYSGAMGVAMQFTYSLHNVGITRVLEYQDLIADYNNGIYWVIIFVGDASDLSYSTEYSWWSLFRDYYVENWFYKRVIDQKEEGITPPHFKKGEQDIDDPTGVAWNLVYKSKNQYDPDNPEAFDKDNAIECYLYPSDNINITVPGAGATITASNLDAGKYYYVVPQNSAPSCSSAWGNKKVEIKDTNGLYAHVDGTGEKVDNPWTGSGYTWKNYYVVIYKSNNDVVVEQWYWKHAAGRGGGGYERTKINTQTSSSVDLISEASVRYFSSTTYYNKMEDITGTREEWSIGSWVTSFLSSIDVLDRTDSRILKIIKVPYSFLEYKNGSIYSTDWVAQQVTQGSGGAQTTHYALKLMNSNAKFNCKIPVEFNPLEVLKLPDHIMSPSDLRNDVYESKIYNSEFYSPKFVYDSFAYTYNLENVDVDAGINLNNVIDYTVTTTMNSRFMFGMNVPLKRSTSDYDNICLVARNNELPIYNSSYINYIRGGYNYDVKAKQLQAEQKGAGIATSAITGIASGALLGAFKGSTAGVYGAIIGAGVGIATGLISSAYQQAQADNNLKQKLDELSKQAISVSGSDDIDLLDKYTNGNKAKYCIYECSDSLKQVMYDIFYYCGYNDDVRQVPNLNSRIWFNYIQCEPVFNESNNLVYKEYLDDIKQRYQEGVTVYHRVNNSYDWDQTHENWEASII